MKYSNTMRSVRIGRTALRAATRFAAPGGFRALPRVSARCLGTTPLRLNPINIDSLKFCATDTNGLMDQPANPKYKLALVSTYVPGQKLGGSDKMTNGHRFDSIPLANGCIKQGMSCQIVFYNHEEHDKFFEVIKEFDGIVIRANPGQIGASGGDQLKFDGAMMDLQAKGMPMWPSPDVMAKMGAKDALCQVKEMPFGLPDTFGFYTPEDMKRDFPKGIAFQPRVVKQNRGSAGEGIWIIRLKDESKYCKNFGDRVASGDEMLSLMEANDNHVEEHTIDEFIEFCANGRTAKSGEWASVGKGHYFAGGPEAGGIMVDQRYLPRIDEGEARFMCIGKKLNRIEHYEYPDGVSGNYKQTIFPPDAAEWKQCRDMLEGSVEQIMKNLDLKMTQLPLLWAADFMPIDDHVSPFVLGEFNCSCLGIAGFFNARGHDLSKAENAASGQQMCDDIGAAAFAALEAR